MITLLPTTLLTAQRPARITQQVDSNQRVTLHGNTHPLARAEFDRGPAPDSVIADRMMLVLSRSDEQEKALRQLLDEQQTPGSPNFRKWSTPEEFGQQFGPSDTDIQTVTTWLLNNGFQVTKVSPGRNFIEFSGTAGQLRHVFRADLHKYVVNGQEHWANANDPQIPAALAPVVKGIASLNNFPRRRQSHHVQAFKRDVQTGEASPLMTTGGSTVYYLLGPADFGVIYNSSPLVQAGNDGTGQKIAIVGKTNINPQDVTDFRNLFGLPNTPDNHTSVILNGPDPGILDNDQTEALLDVEWAGAVAPGASIVLVASESTTTADGIDLSALYVVENNLAPVMSISYGTCEAALTNAGNQFYQLLFEQAAAQGITVTVAAGDSGSAGCDNPNTATVAQHGTAVSGIASTPFNIAVGGTDFNDAGTQSTYFNSDNIAGTWLSAKGYIPEMPWNDSCAGGASPTTGSCTSSSNLQLWAGSGGPSSCSKTTNNTCSGTAKPTWQTGKTPSDGVRDIPDLSLFAASGTAGSRSLYVMCEADLVSGNPSCQPPSGGSGDVYLVTVAGTSASSPAFAGVVALANQKAGRLGNLNYLLYPIASQAGVFHDVTIGSNSVPCKGGTPNCSASTGTGVLVSSNRLAYTAGAGYDLATGLGSPDITNLVNAIETASSALSPTTTSLTLAPVNAVHGQSISLGIEVTDTSNNPVSTGDVSLIGNDDSDNQMGITRFRLPSDPNWASVLFPGGTYKVHAHYSGDGTHGASDSNPISVTIAPEDSKTFVNLVTFNLNGTLGSFTATSAAYGSPYIVRMDVGDSAATISSTSGVSSKCTKGTATCPTGTLTVMANESPLDGGNWPLNNAGHSEDQPIQLPAGNYNIVANYPGDASYNASSGSTTISISKTQTSATAGVKDKVVKYGIPATLSAEIDTNSNGAIPTGTVTFFDGTTAISGPVTYGGNDGQKAAAKLTATVPYTFTSAGSQTISVRYSGDANYLSSISPNASVSVIPFGLTPASAVTVAAPGQNGTTTITVSPYGGFNGSVNLSCTPPASAAETTCGFSQGSGAAQSTVTVSLAGTDVPVTFAVTTTASHTLAQNRLGIRTGAGILVCGIFLFGIPAVRRRPVVLVTMLVLAVMFTVASCGGGSSSGGPRTDPGTARGTYAFSISGTTGSGSSAVTVPAQVTVTVN